MQVQRPPVLVLACGALANEIVALCRLNRWEHVDLQCLPAHLHNRPDTIVPRIREKLAELAPLYQRILVGYADCGTGGLLDVVIQEFSDKGYVIERLPGAHCYEFFAGSESFHALNEEEPGTFYLTDFLLRHFDQLVVKALGIDQYPQLQAMYFGHYQRVLYLAQVVNNERLAAAKAAAQRLGLAFDYRVTGYGELEQTMHTLSTEVMYLKKGQHGEANCDLVA